MFKLAHLSALLLCLAIAVPGFAEHHRAPVTPVKKSAKHPGKKIPARHNVGRRIHG